MAAYRDRSGTVRFQYTDWQGVRRTVTCKDKTLPEARKLWAAKQNEHDAMRRGESPPPPKPFDWNESLNRWLERSASSSGRQWSSSHAVQTERVMGNWTATLAALFPPQWKTAALRRLQVLSATKSPSWTRLHGATLKAFVSFCYSDEGSLTQNPLATLKLPAPEATRPQRRALSGDEAEALLSCSKIPAARRLLYEVALSTGLRVSELRSLQGCNLALGGLRLDSKWTKNREAGFQPLPQALWRRLQRLRRKPQENLLKTGNRWHNARTLRADMLKAGLKTDTPEGRLDFHCLRVSFITAVVDSGATVPEAMRLARHSTPVLTLKTYARTQQNRLKDIVEAVCSRCAGRGKKGRKTKAS